METGICKLQSKKEPAKYLIFKAVEMTTELEKHMVELKKGKHPNKRLQDHVDKYGSDDLVCVLMFPCNKTEIAQKEAHFIERFNPYFNGVDPVKQKPIKVLVEELPEVEAAVMDMPEVETAVMPEPKVRKTRKRKTK